MFEPFVTLICKSKAPVGLRKFPVKAMPFATPGVSAVVPVFVSTRSSDRAIGTSFAVIACEKKPNTGSADGALSVSAPVAATIFGKVRLVPAAIAPSCPAAATEVSAMSPALTVGKVPDAVMLFT